MKFIIKHEIKGRIRISLARKFHTVREADVLEQYLLGLDGVTAAKVYERTADAVIYYKEDREAVLVQVAAFDGQITEKQEMAVKSSGRALNQEYKEKLIQKVLTRFATKTFLPAPVRAVYTSVQAIRYIVKGIHCLVFKRKLHVEVLDATAISVSLLRRDFNTAGSVMFLLGVGELLEEWTHKKSVGDLARSMSLNVEKVWKKVDGTEVFVPLSDVTAGDELTVHMGTVIPLDGVVVSGEAMVNQASMTGESQPVRKEPGSYVYAGTALEEGEITFKVEKSAGSTRYERIVQMIEDSEKLKSSVEGKASNLADALVPWSLGGTALTYLLTRNATKALSILMVDFSCALKLAMPLAVLSAMREASQHHITVKGGKFLEAVAEAETIVFDKTGTLTKGVFDVTGIYPGREFTEDELLEYAAYAESYSSHPISKSLKNAYGKELDASNVSDVEEISGHGVTAKVNGRQVAAGNAKLMKSLNLAYTENTGVGTVVHVAVDGKYAGYILISDVIKDGAKEAIASLKNSGVKKCVMLTGDSKTVAEHVAGELKLDEVHSELLPADKVSCVEKLLQDKSEKEKLAFVGDGINDAPVLSRADIGIAMGALGSDAAIEAADVVLMDDNPAKIALAMRISRKCLRIVYENIVFALAVKAICLILGALGIANMWVAIFADVGVMVLAVLNAIRCLRIKNN